MLTQREFVEGCLRWYRESDLQPGNPEDGEWHECHYPKPKCLGGTETILLLKQHHAVQGVLQSEEFQHPCIYGWEKKYLDAASLHLWKQWMGIKTKNGISKIHSQPQKVKEEWCKKGAANQPLEAKSIGGKIVQAKRSLAEKRELAKHMHKITAEERKKAIEKAKQTNLKNNPNHFGDMARKARDSEPREVKAARAKMIPKEANDRGRALTNSRKFRCLETGKVSTAGPLTRYQKARGIDPSHRIQIQP